MVQAKRAARVQRAEFANRGPTEKKKEARLRGTETTKRAVEALPQWHCRSSSRLEGDSRGREKAEEEERLRWAGEVADFIFSLDTPTAVRAHKAPNPKTSALRTCSKVRAATVRSCVRAWRPFWAWRSTHTVANAVGTRAQQLGTACSRAMCTLSDPPNTSSPRTLGRIGGHSTGVKSKQMSVDGQASRCARRYSHWNGKRTSVATHSTYLAAAVLLFMNQEQPPVLRCCAFWRCLEARAALRFSDHRGLSPASCSFNETSFRGTLSRIKTTGTDKKRCRTECFTSAAIAGF